ncbi:MAG: acetate--CoA ligase family protein [Candidatus Kapabacteria bacterium]|nr:acetate--CoA ligase family protein [Candidatus Kapabacteria bacterium]MDW7996946.1 acetate--CoA ligase family protein [Bacteroidota bacterium]MDW8224855.1 acetate--CoA ligase family protein [Bacteroidota bacterium]
MSALAPPEFGVSVDVRPLLEPRSLAVIGASRQPHTVGWLILDNLLTSGYTGVVYPVNPQAHAVRGVRAYPTIEAVPDEVELAVITVPAPLVAEVLEACGRHGVRAAIVISAGFKEIGPEGAAREAQLRHIVQRHNIVLLGPNCLGLMNTDPAVQLNATFGQALAQRGSIGFISQSGALCAAVLDYTRAQNIGLSKVISLGNKAGVTEVELLAYLWRDPLTSVILLYIEELSDGSRFLELAHHITSDSANPKPILALKAGRTIAGARAVASHTGSLAGSDEVYQALFKQAGVLRVETVEDLFEYATAFANQPIPNGQRVAIVTNAGGPGIMAADTCIQYGLEVPSLSEPEQFRIRCHLPTHAGVSNPIDLIADARSERYACVLEALLHDPTFDALLVLFVPIPTADMEAIAQVIIEAARQRLKPIVACFMGVVDVGPAKASLRAAGVPCYDFPEDAARALAAMARYHRWRIRPQTGYRTFEVCREEATALLTRAQPTLHGFIPEDIAFRVLEAYGFPLLPWASARTPEEAVQAAHTLGFPVALKVLSPDIIHKFDIGGVLLHLDSAETILRGFQQIRDSVSHHAPEARFEGVIVQKMGMRGYELIVGIKRDPQFGPIVMVGLGGIYVEVFRDVAFRIAPLRERSAYQMLKETRVSALLRGVRGQPPSDIGAVAETLLRLSQLSLEQPLIEELDINPLLVYPRGNGVAVVDVRIAVRRHENTA